MEPWDENWFWPRPFRRFMRDIDRMFENMFREMSARIPKEMFRERELPDGTKIRTLGPIIYGYSVTVGPDGVPKIRTFGNLRPEYPFPVPTEVREPIVDIITTPNLIRVTVELPGVKKDDIELYATETKLTILVDTPERKYHREIDLPARVDPKSAEATYSDGILEVTLRRIEEERQGERIRVK
jgi:HSP20 family protein